jgi:hypothetical protein
MSFIYNHCLKRFAAILSCASLAFSTTVLADDSSLTEDWLLSHNFYIAAVTGPWVHNNKVKTESWEIAAVNNYDYSYGGGYFVKDDNGQLWLKNFYLSGLDVPVSVTKEEITNSWGGTSTYNYLNIDISGTHKISSENYNYGNCTVEIYECGLPTIETTQPEATDENPSPATHSVVKFTPKEEQPQLMKFPMVKSEDGGQYWGIDYWGAYQEYIQTRSWVFVIKDAETKEVKQYINMVYPRIESVTEHNAMAYDYNLDGKIIREYPVQISLYGETGFFLSNYNALGLNNASIDKCSNSNMYETTTSVINFLKYINIFVFNAKNAQSRRDLLDDFTAETVMNADDADQIDYFQYEYNGTAHVETYRICGTQEDGDFVCQGKNQGDNIEGHLVLSNDDVHHNLEETDCPWVTNGGDRETLANAQIEFINNGLKDTNTGEFIEKLQKTVIKWKKRDYTLDVDLSELSLKQVDDDLYVSGTITPKQNLLFVDHYEVCIAPAEDNISAVAAVASTDLTSNLSIDKSMTFDKTTKVPFNDGFANATNLQNYDVVLEDEIYDDGTPVTRIDDNDLNADETASDSTADSASTNDDEKDVTAEDQAARTFAKAINISDLNGTSTTGNYIVYIKAIYKESTGLTPTYHSIQTAQTDVVLAVNKVELAKNVSVAGGNGIAVVKGDFNQVAVYSTSGVLVYRGSESTFSLNPGLYIITVDNKPFKVVVR